MSQLGPALDRLTALLDAGQRVAVHAQGTGPDQIMVWEWLRAHLNRRYGDLDVCALHLRCGVDPTPASEAACYLVARAVATEGGTVAEACRLELPEADADDLVAVLYDRRREMIRHYGLLLTRAAQRRAFDRVLDLAVRRPGRLCRACDLLDEALLAYRQSLLALARTTEQADRLARAFSTIALAIERSQAPSMRASGAANGAGGARLTLLEAARGFQSVVGALGGPDHAAVVGPNVIEDYARLAA